MRNHILQLVIAVVLLAPIAGYSQCTGRFCYPVDSGAREKSIGSTLDSQISTLNHSPHCRIHVGDGSSTSSFVGSGTLISKDDATALVLTCSHLFDESSSNIVVTFPSGDRYGARLVNRDRAHDLAALLIRVPAETPLAVDDSDPVGVLTACGYGGDGRFTPVRGAITGAAQAVGATFPSLKIGGAVRPGDSGGGVLNTVGQLVGVVWGCREGETYFTCGTPLRNFLARIRHPIARREPGRPRPRDSALPLDPDTWRSDIESRLTNLETTNQNRGNFIERSELTTLIAKSSAELQQTTTSRIDSLKSILFDCIEERVNTVTPGLLSGLSTGKLLAGALGLSGPLALAVMAAGALAGRRLKQRASASANSPPSTLNPQHFPIAVDTPPPPQQTVPESHYIPVERDSFARAHQWAREQVARKYPGATEVLSTLESLIKQQLAGNN
ncbi:MAG: serine protease [Pirellulales bacterium]